MRESKIEGHFVREAEAMGCLCPKFTSPTHNGMMDRILFVPGGRTVLPEFKAPGKDLRPTQKRMRDRLVALGVDVRKVSTMDEANALLREINGWLTETRK